jgi:hypothetical protein
VGAEEGRWPRKAMCFCFYCLFSTRFAGTLLWCCSARRQGEGANATGHMLPLYICLLLHLMRLL